MADEFTGSPPDLSAILGELLSNKEIMDKISEITDAQKPSSQAVKEASTEPASIESLLSNPDIISKLPEVINVIKPLVSGGKDESPKSHEIDKRLGLLMAMKPYLSPKRCEAIDYIARMSKLSETVKGLKL